MVADKSWQSPREEGMRESKSSSLRSRVRSWNCVELIGRSARSMTCGSPPLDDCTTKCVLHVADSFGKTM